MTAALLAPALGQAHTAWLEPVAGEPRHYEVLFGGHADQLETYDSAKIVSIDAYDAAGRPLDVLRRDAPGPGEGNTVLTLAPDTALVAIHFDNGIWARDPMGRSVNRPLNEVPGASRATNAIKYHKTIVQWSPVVTLELGQRFEVIPLSESQPRAGEPMRVKVLLDGKALPGVKLGQGEAGDAGETDAEGIATFVPQPGFNRLWAGKRFAVDEPGYTELSYEYLLGFEAR
ncbi:DUF4198 domain-containing protein [Parahaliea mediterranea]|uniref:DUF4198 domain-containing protein n=1 Tax=Parahaliea mediterranea TaxID=651086 RepID=A0A939DJN4_9GAMM|nr:DUF4198 domain-containing protein [Parahaliea mediterranea]MBN7798742.1 DUF4198 domain-containing protein [Parahaliea mediterranea]